MSQDQNRPKPSLYEVAKAKYIEASAKGEATAEIVKDYYTLTKVGRNNGLISQQKFEQRIMTMMTKKSSENLGPIERRASYDARETILKDYGSEDRKEQIELAENNGIKPLKKDAPLEKVAHFMDNLRDTYELGMTKSEVVLTSMRSYFRTFFDTPDKWEAKAKAIAENKEFCEKISMEADPDYRRIMQDHQTKLATDESYKQSIKLT